jgi:hypothetical protein
MLPEAMTAPVTTPLLRQTSPPVAGASALLLVETPFQLLCAHEMIRAYALDHTLVLRMTGVGRNDEQLRRAAVVLGLEHVEITVRVGRHNVDTVLALPMLLLPLARGYDHLFLGSYFSRFIMTIRRVVRARNTWLLDDGIATFLAQDRMAAATGKPFDLATLFDVAPLDGQTVLCHAFSHLAGLNDVDYADTTLFIGQPVVELGLMTRAQYWDIVSACKREAAAAMIYVPHRREDREHVDALLAEFGLKVHHPDVCVELHLVQTGTVPRQVYTCISTAAFALARMFPQCGVTILPSTMVDVSPHARAVLDHAATIPNVRIVTEVNVADTSGDQALEA